MPKNKYLQVLSDFKNERTRKVTSITLTLLALIIFSLFAINPTISTIAKLQKELSDSEFAHQQLQRKITNLSSLQNQYSKLQNDLPTILNALPQSPNAPLLIAQIQSVGQTSKININSLQNFQVELFNQNAASKKYSSYSFSFSGAGSYEDISTFISNLVSMQRIIDFDVLSINKTENQNSLKLNIQGVTYYK